MMLCGSPGRVQVPTLVASVQSDDPTARAGAVTIATTLAEDVPAALVPQGGGSGAADSLMPPLATLLSDPAKSDAAGRAAALHAFSALAALHPAWMEANAQGYVQGLLQLGSSESNAGVLQVRTLPHRSCRHVHPICRIMHRSL